MHSFQRRKPINLRQLCALARCVIEAHPALDERDWIHRLKCELLAQGFAYPEPWSLIESAIARVLAASRSRWGGPRPPLSSSRATAAPVRSASIDVDLGVWAPEHLAAIRRAAGTPEAYAAITAAEERARGASSR